VASIRALKSAVGAGVVEVVHPGEARLSGRALERLGTASIRFVVVTTNLIGAASVVVICLFAVPLPTVAHEHHVRVVNVLVAAGYVAFAIPAGVVLGSRGMRRVRDWLLAERAPSLEDARIVLQAPARLFALQLSLWVGGTVLFGVLDIQYSLRLGLEVAVTVLLAGSVTASCAYLLTELLLRPAAVRALADGAPGRLAVPGVATRAVLAWAMGTGLPVLGVVAIGILSLSAPNTASHQLGVSMIVLGGAGIVVGLLAVTVAARATADPVNSVRRALATVQRGDFDVRVPVYDGTQIGQLQLGFNAMVGGLAERERMREAFGTYVDPDVARRILDEGVRLDGEEVEVTVMFVDVRDFTGFAERTPAAEVVSAINRLFERIIPIIHDRQGRVDKFVGDGLLAVFGAPRHQADHADQALGAALEIEKAMATDDGELEIGIGLNSGKVVAGNVGGAGRLEFSVIGDAVNVAARVEAATRETGDTILLAEQTRALLRDPPSDLTERSAMELKGKTEKVRLYAPRERQPQAGSRG
jgi:adenylate cyclase